MTTLIPQLPTYIDSTMISCFRSCPRKFFNEFILGLRPPGISIDLHAGGVFAHCLDVVRREVFVNHRNLDEALLRASAAFEIAWGEFTIPNHKKTNKRPDRVWAAVESYFAKYPPHTDHVQPYFIDGKPTFEWTFAVPLENNNHWPVHPETKDPFMYVGRCDMLGEYMGLPVICDDKTSGSGHYSGWTEKWDLRGQFIGYTWAAKQLGLDTDTVVVRGVGIQMKDIAHAEAIKPYSDHLRSLWLEQLRRDMWRIVNMWQKGYWDYNLAESCVDFGGCIFSTACQSSTPETWLQNFEVRRWNPTRANPVEAAA